MYPLFADLTVVHSHASGDAPERVSALVADAEVVVIELVERDLVSDTIPVLSPELRAVLTAALR